MISSINFFGRFDESISKASSKWLTKYLQPEKVWFQVNLIRTIHFWWYLNRVYLANFVFNVFFFLLPSSKYKTKKKGKTLTHNEIDLDLHQFKDGKIRCEIEGPSRADIHYINNNDGHIRLSYKVTIPGEYRIQIKYNTFFVCGSPFVVQSNSISKRLKFNLLLKN